MIDKADTYCGKCIKADVCGMEDVYDPAMTFCAYRVEARPRGEWNILQKDDNGIHEIECSFCKYSKGGRFASVGITFHKLPPFCEACGADMRNSGGMSRAKVIEKEFKNYTYVDDRPIGGFHDD